MINNIVIAAVTTIGVALISGWRVAVRVLVMGLIAAVVMATLFNEFIPCDGGFGTGFRLAFGVIQCK